MLTTSAKPSSSLLSTDQSEEKLEKCSLHFLMKITWKCSNWHTITDTFVHILDRTLMEGKRGRNLYDMDTAWNGLQLYKLNNLYKASFSLKLLAVPRPERWTEKPAKICQKFHQRFTVQWYNFLRDPHPGMLVTGKCQMQNHPQS